MYTDIIQPLRLNVLELQKMADSGGDVIAKVYYQAKQMGYSTSQIVNMMETIGNDATKRITVLKNFNTEQEYNNSLAEQTVQLTSQQAAQFEEYRTATTNLSRAWETWSNDTLAPIAERLAGILNLMTSIINSKPITAAAEATGEQGIKFVKDYQADYQKQIRGNSSIYGQQLNEQDDAQNATLMKNLQGKLDAAEQLQADLTKLNTQYNQGTDKAALSKTSQTFQTSKDKTKASIDLLDTQWKQYKEMMEKSVVSAYGGNTKAMQADLDKAAASYKEKRDDLVKSLTKDEDAAADKAKKKAEAAAKAQLTADKKLNTERLQAQQNLTKAVADMTLDSNLRQLAEFDRQQNALIENIKKSAAKLGIDPAQLLGQQKASSAEKRTDLVNGMIGYTEPNQSLNVQNSLIKSGNLSEGQKNFLAQQQNSRINSDNPFNYDNTDQKLKDNQAEMDAELAQNDLLLNGHEDYEKRKAEITAKYNNQALKISRENSLNQLNVFSTAADSLADGMVAAFGKSSGAAQVAMAAQRGISMAMIGMNLATALSSALATPFPASLAAYAQVLSLGMNLITTAKGATSSGQFHGGVDELPQSMDNKSFVLKAGERVVQPEANKKLSKFLDKQDSTGSSGDITVNAPLIINGSTDDDSKFQEMLKKHANSVSQAVRDSQKRNS